jgi:ribose 5-phosphate isomerase A
MTPDEFKRRAAEKALEWVRPGMTLGLGTGSTAAHFVDLLGARVREGLVIVGGVPTSDETRRRAEAAGIEIIEPDETTVVDLAVDGTDEVDGRLDLIKGGGGALLREKIVAGAAKEFVVIADAGKRVAQLGKFPLPIEIDRFAYGLTTKRVREVLKSLGQAGEIRLRSRADRTPFVTDGEHYILDCALGRIADSARLDAALKTVPGVVETGLFVGMAHVVILAGPGGIEVLRR